MTAGKLKTCEGEIDVVGRLPTCEVEGCGAPTQSRKSRMCKKHLLEARSKLQKKRWKEYRLNSLKRRVKNERL